MRAILERDFIQFAKSPRYFVARFVAVALPLFLLGCMAAVTSLRDDDLGKMIFHTTLWPILIIAAMFSPSMVAPILVEERRSNRLEVLRSTPMSAAQIVIGRWSSRVLLLWSMLIAALPLTAASVLFGGVAPSDFFVGAAVVLLTVPMLSSIALFVSAGGGDAGAVLRLTYALVLGLLLLPWFLLGPLRIVMSAGATPGSAADTLVAQVLWHMAAADPLVALSAALFSGGTATGAFGLPPLAVFTLWSLGITGVMVAWSIRRITRPVGRRKNVEAEQDSNRSRAAASDASRSSIAKSKGRFSAGLAQLWRNPPLWLELRRSQSRPGRFRRVAFWIVMPVLELGFLMILYQAQGPSSSTTGYHIFPLVVSFLFCVFAIAATGATAVHRDGQANTLDVLHASPLENGLLAAAKVGGALRAGLVWFSFGVGHLVLAVVVGDIKVVTAVASVVMAAGMLFSLAGFSVRFGMTARTLNRASSRVMGTVVSHLVISPMLAGMLVMGLGDGDAFAFFLGHHPVWIVGLPMAAQEGSARAVTSAFFWFPMVYFAVYLWIGIQTTFHSIPLKYSQLRDDTKVVGYEPG